MLSRNNKVLLTGANGLLGSNIAHQLVLKGYRVVALIRKGSNLAALEGIECEILEGNISNSNDVEKAIRDCEYVIHCAAKTDQTGDVSKFEQANITATRILINLSGKYNIKRFVFVSTANCFTNGSIDHPGDENSHFMPWLKKSGYAYSKFLAQEMVLKEFNETGFPAVVVVPTFMVGPRDAKISSGKLLMHGLKHRIVFYPPGGKSFVDAEYAAEATVNALTMGPEGECYLLAGENLTYRQFFRKVKNLTSRKMILIPLPSVFLTAIAAIFSLVQRIFRLSLPFNLTNQRLLCLDNYFSNKKAITELYLKPTSTETSILKAKTWFENKKYL
jgi:dihydroflavonol-4-reductase